MTLSPGPSTLPPSDTVGARSLTVIIPTFNAAAHWPALRSSLAEQGVSSSRVLIVDSSSSDGTRQLAEQSGYRVLSIRQEDFGHGRTRQLASAHDGRAEFLLFMTQDALLHSPNAIEVLTQAMSDEEVGAAYGRQTARPGANAIERHARLFNYPETNQTRSLSSRTTLGIKAAFLSNSFALYRRSALEQVGGFPENVIFGEDSYVAAKMLLAGWKIAYRGDAVVVHSHAFSVWQEFRRYFDIGVHHQREGWMLHTFGSPSGEGLRFLRSELQYVRPERLMLQSLLRTGAKLMAYRLGRLWRWLPTALNRRLSSNPGFWRNTSA